MATGTRLNSASRFGGPTIVGVENSRPPHSDPVSRPAAVVVYVEAGAGEGALRIATEGAAMRSASLAIVEPMTNGADVADRLIRESRTAELLVVGTIQTSPTEPLRFDSLMRSLSHHAECPVMIVPPTAARMDITEIVCGVDRSIGSAAALRWAAHEAAARGGTVLAQQVQTWTATYGDSPRQSLSGWVFAQEISEPTTIVCRLSSANSVATELMHSTLERHAMLVIGSHRHDGGHPHRCVTGRLAGHTSVPLVVVPPEIPGQRKPPGTP